MLHLRFHNWHMVALVLSLLSPDSGECLHNWHMVTVVLSILAPDSGKCFRRSFIQRLQWHELDPEPSIQARISVTDRCSSFCVDAAACKKAKCHYDYKHMHCFSSIEIAEASKIVYPFDIVANYSECVNVGGKQHWDSDGYSFFSDTGRQSTAGKKFTTTNNIQGAKDADQYIYQTQKRGPVLKYNLKPIGGRGYFQARMLFAEWETNRSVTIKFNGHHYIRRGFNILSEVAMNTAYVLDVAFKIIKQRVHVIGQQSTFKSPHIMLDLAHPTLTGSTKYATLNGICATRMHDCTVYCDDPVECNKLSGCFYDITTQHCLTENNQATSCDYFNGQKKACERQGCEYCCGNSTCVEHGLAASDCNVGCNQFCSSESDCNKHGCSFHADTGACKDKERTCEYLVNAAHDPLENCLACTGSQCSFILDTEPHACVPYERVGNRTWGKTYYTTKQQCDLDCNLHISNETQSTCLGCVRGNHCVLEFEACSCSNGPPKCLPTADVDVELYRIINPFKALVHTATRCHFLCKKLSNNPEKCRDTGCNYCCSTGQCYAAHEGDPECSSGCENLCNSETDCLEFGCYYDRNTNQCMDNRTACSHFSGKKGECLARNCDYCCQKNLCIPTEDTAADILHEHPPQVITMPGCCEGSKDRFQSACHIELDGHHVAGKEACNAAKGAYTGNFKEGGCPHNYYKYECSRKIPFWSICIFGGRDLRTIGESTCETVGSTFENEVSGTTCPDGSYRFLCGDGTYKPVGEVVVQGVDGRILSRLKRSRIGPGEYSAAKKVYGRTTMSCASNCMDAALCKQSGCVYDYRGMHCVDPYESELFSGVDYGTERPQTNSHCINVGGLPHQDINGYNYDGDYVVSTTTLPSRSYTYPSDTKVSGADLRDAYLYQTEIRGGIVHDYLKLFGGDGRFQLRMHFCELKHTYKGHRFIDIDVNEQHRVKSWWDVFADFGKGAAVILDYPLSVENGMLKMDGYSTKFDKEAIPVQVRISNSDSSALINAWCLTRMPHCTAFCEDMDACNAQAGCLYHLETKHCLPKSYFVIACENYDANKSGCLEQGCQFCCKTNYCHDVLPPDIGCNDGCNGFCFDEMKCMSANCKYDEDYGICENKVVVCSELLNGIRDLREQCKACVLGKCAYVIANDEPLCAERALPLSTFENLSKYYNTSGGCNAGSTLLSGEPLECRERGYTYCCATGVCYTKGEPGIRCPTGCSQWCYNKESCIEHKCFYDELTHDCENYPLESPCDRCDQCDRLSCEVADCYFDDVRDTCFPEITIYNQTSCEMAGGKYCKCGEQNCIKKGQECKFPANEAECLDRGCFYNLCSREQCSEKQFHYERGIFPGCAGSPLCVSCCYDRNVYCYNKTYESPCKPPPGEINEKTFSASFWTHPAATGRSLEVTVYDTCTNVPNDELDLSPDVSNNWPHAIDSVVFPEGRCISLFNQDNCCGFSIDYYVVSEGSHVELGLRNNIHSYKACTGWLPPITLPTTTTPPTITTTTTEIPVIATVPPIITIPTTTTVATTTTLPTHPPTTTTTLPPEISNNRTICYETGGYYCECGKEKCIFDEDIECEDPPTDEEECKERGCFYNMCADEPCYEDPLKEIAADECSHTPPCDSCCYDRVNYCYNTEEGESPCYIRPGVPNKNAYEARFFVNPNHEGEILNVGVYETCANIPSELSQIRGLPRLNRWTQVISSVKLPIGRCIRIFNEPYCCGISYNMYKESEQNNFALLGLNLDDNVQSYKACSIPTGPGS